MAREFLPKAFTNSLASPADNRLRSYSDYTIMYKVLYSNRAAKSLRRLDKTTLKRIIKAVDSLSQNPLLLGHIKLTGFGKADYRLRVGNFRILYTFDSKQKVLIIADVKRRTTTTYS